MVSGATFELFIQGVSYCILIPEVTLLNIKLHTWQVLPNNDNIKFVSIKFSGLVGEDNS